MTFKIVWGNTLPGHSCGKAAEIFYGPRRICALNTWAFASCACFSIHDFSSWDAGALEGHVDELFSFLCSPECQNTWMPEEVYFLLSQNQQKNNWAKEMIKHPKVKRRDEFTNKSHGGDWCYLYRYSAAEDFKR